MTAAAVQLADWAASLRADDVPVTTRAAINAHVLDTLGVAIAATTLETSTMAQRLAESWSGPGTTPVIGGGRLRPREAAFVGGVLAHSLDFDDTHLPSVLHPSASLVPAALAIASSVGASQADLVIALAIGYEVCIRLGMAGRDGVSRNSLFFDRGWHATSICGAIGAAAVAAHLLALPPRGTLYALAIASSLASGILEANRAGGTVKRLHCGWAAQAGLSAAAAAQAGFSGPPTVFEGRFGFLHAFLGGAGDVEAVTRGLGRGWAIDDVAIKPYPSNHFTHTALDAGRALREDGIDLAEIDALELAVAEPTLRTIAEPIERKRQPTTPYEAQFSGPFAVALGLTEDAAITRASFGPDRLTDSRVLGLARIVSCTSDPACDQAFPDQFPAILRARLRDGRIVETRVMQTLGTSARPLPAAAVEDKFRANIDGLIAPDTADWLIRATLGEGDATPSAIVAATATLASQDGEKGETA